MNINNNEIPWTESIKFLGVLLDENLSRKTLIKYIENKISKNSGILFKARSFLNKKSLLSLYYSNIHININYGSISWGSICRTNFNKSMLFASFLIKASLSIPVNCLNLAKF